VFRAAASFLSPAENNLDAVDVSDVAKSVVTTDGIPGESWLMSCGLFLEQGRERLAQPPRAQPSRREHGECDTKDSRKPWSEAEEQDLDEVTKKVAEFERTHPKQSRIAAVCRFSIVDFEQHDYV